MDDRGPERRPRRGARGRRDGPRGGRARDAIVLAGRGTAPRRACSPRSRARSRAPVLTGERRAREPAAGGGGQRVARRGRGVRPRCPAARAPPAARRLLARDARRAGRQTAPARPALYGYEAARLVLDAVRATEAAAGPRGGPRRARGARAAAAARPRSGPTGARQRRRAGPAADALPARGRTLRARRTLAEPALTPRKVQIFRVKRVLKRPAASRPVLGWRGSCSHH